MSRVKEAYNPRSVQEALEVIAGLKGKDYRFMAGCTDIMVFMREKKVDPEYLVDLTRVRELARVAEDGGFLRIGPMATHHDLMRHSLITTHAPILAAGCAEVGSPQIRHLGTLGGNVCTGSPAGDALPPLAVLGARFCLSEKGGGREVPFEAFFTGPQKTDLREGEMLTDIVIEKMDPAESHCFLKLGQRNALTVAKISLAARCAVRDGRISGLRIALGSVAPTVVRARGAEAFLEGKALDADVISAAVDLIRKDIRPIDDIRSTATYRLHAAGVLLRKYLRQILGTPY